jgi:hypothetical protein
MLGFFAASFVSSVLECGVLCIVGGATVSSFWYLTLEMGFEDRSFSCYAVFVSISVPSIWFSLFWIRVLFIPNSRSKISVFSPIPTSSCQVSFRNDDLIPMIAGSWLTIWLFLVTIGWSIAIRQDPVVYKSQHKLTSFPQCCKDPPHRDAFQNWFSEEYVPGIRRRQKKSVSNRRFLVFQPSPSRQLHEQVNGLFTAFGFSIVSDREMLVDWPAEMNEVLSCPGWEWDYSVVFPKHPITPAIVDLVAMPSYIVPPAHKWKWADILQENVTKKILGDDQVILIDCDDFLSPFLWLNPTYRGFLCSLSTIDMIYENFGGSLLNWSSVALNVSKAILKEMHGEPVILYADSRIAARQRLRQMTDTMLRCADAVDSGDVPWLVVRNGGGLSRFPAWPGIGRHDTYLYYQFRQLDELETAELKAAVLYCLARSSKGVIGFTGSGMSESIAYTSGSPLFMVLHRTPFCSQVPIRIPCISKWKSVLNSPSINLSRFMSAEMTNMLKCQV